jgi:hypothetical protein
VPFTHHYLISIRLSGWLTLNHKPKAALSCSDVGMQKAIINPGLEDKKDVIF